MKIKVNQKLKNLDGEVLKETGPGDKLVDVDLKLIIVNALLIPIQEDKGIDKMKKYELAKMIHNSKVNVDLTAEDISFIKKQVGDNYSPLVVGQMFEILEK